MRAKAESYLDANQDKMVNELPNAHHMEFSVLPGAYIMSPLYWSNKQLNF